MKTLCWFKPLKPQRTYVQENISSLQNTDKEINETIQIVLKGRNQKQFSSVYMENCYGTYTRHRI